LRPSLLVAVDIHTDSVYITDFSIGSMLHRKTGGVCPAPDTRRYVGVRHVFALSIGDDHGAAREAFAKVGGGFAGLAADDIQLR
jgi:hypothetical protein